MDKLELKNQQIELEAGKYKLTITCVLIGVLLLGLIVVLTHFIRVNRMKNLLEISDRELKKDKEQLMLSEKALFLAKEKAEASNRLKDVFLSNLSHEIRTPLNSIVGFSSLLGNLYDKAETKEYASIIKHNSDLLLKLVNDTVSVSLLQTDQLPLVWEDIDVIQFCHSLLDEYKSKSASQVEMDFQSTMDVFELHTDKARLKQLLGNLFSNALKFTEVGKISLIFKVEEEKNLAYFIVQDTGCGIPKEMQNKIFESFEKLDAFTQGIGLGLTICKLVSNRLGGSIALDTTYEGGTKMVFTHPIIKND